MQQKENRGIERDVILQLLVIEKNNNNKIDKTAIPSIIFTYDRVYNL